VKVGLERHQADAQRGEIAVEMVVLGAPTTPDLERLFLMRLPRRVRKDATISLAGQLWEVPVHLRGQIVTVHFDPVHWTRVELWLGDRCLGHAHRCNKHLNAQLRSSNDYERDCS